MPHISEHRFVRKDNSRARLWETATRAETLLDVLQDGSPEYLAFIAADLRRFACWCARDAGAASAGVVAHRVLHAAEKYADGMLSASALSAEHASAAGIASSAGTIGLRLRKPLAALILAAVRTADADAIQAARGATYFAALAAVLREGEGAGVVVRLRQVSALRFFIPNPFVDDRRACS